jgi:hypothetical protein
MKDYQRDLVVLETLIILAMVYCMVRVWWLQP